MDKISRKRLPKGGPNESHGDLRFAHRVVLLKTWHPAIGLCRMICVEHNLRALAGVSKVIGRTIEVPLILSDQATSRRAERRWLSDATGSESDHALANTPAAEGSSLSYQIICPSSLSEPPRLPNTSSAWRVD